MQIIRSWNKSGWFYKRKLCRMRKRPLVIASASRCHFHLTGILSFCLLISSTTDVFCRAPCVLAFWPYIHHHVVYVNSLFGALDGAALYSIEGATFMWTQTSRPATEDFKQPYIPSTMLYIHPVVTIAWKVNKKYICSASNPSLVRVDLFCIYVNISYSLTRVGIIGWLSTFSYRLKESITHRLHACTFSCRIFILSKEYKKEKKQEREENEGEEKKREGYTVEHTGKRLVPEKISQIWKNSENSQC